MKHIESICDYTKHTMYTILFENTLSQAEAAVVREAMELHVDGLNHVLVALKEAESEIYALCNPEVPETEEAFRHLNAIRTEKRRVRRQRFIASRAMNVIKRQVNTHVAASAKLGLV